MVPQPPLRIKEAAILLDGKIWTGRRHGEIISKIVEAGGRTPVTADQGFVTECGKFVDRKEAAEIAFAAGQTSKNVRILMSEDLY